MINNAIPGASFHTFAHGNCLKHALPDRPDLLVLEHVSYIEAKGSLPGYTLDFWLNRLRFHFNSTDLPPIIFLNVPRMPPHCGPKHLISPWNCTDPADRLDVTTAPTTTAVSAADIKEHCIRDVLNETTNENATNVAAYMYSKGMIISGGSLGFVFDQQGKGGLGHEYC